MIENLYIFSWDKKLETGIEIIDNQHKEFLKHANRFVIKVRSQKGEEGVKEEYEFIHDFLQYHFQAEETYLFDSGYPEYKQHQAEHLKLQFQAKQMEILIQEGKMEQILEKFVEFINMWVKEHMMGSDLKFSEYYNSKKTK